MNFICSVKVDSLETLAQKDHVSGVARLISISVVPPGCPYWDAPSAPRNPHGRLTAEFLLTPPTGCVAAPGFQHFLTPEHWAPRPSYCYGLMRPWNDLDFCLPRHHDLLHNPPQQMAFPWALRNRGGERSGAGAHIYLTGVRLPLENGQSGFLLICLVAPLPHYSLNRTQ